MIQITGQFEKLLCSHLGNTLPEAFMPPNRLSESFILCRQVLVSLQCASAPVLCDRIEQLAETNPGLIGQIIAAIGIQGIAIDMLSIDENFLMISKPKDVGKQLLYTPNILEQVFVFNPTILRIRLDVLLFEQAGYLKRKSRDYYLSLFDLLCDIAEIMESFDKLSNYLGNPTNE